MPITVTCRCGTTATVPDSYAGRTGQCNACKQPITVPDVPPAQAQAPQPQPVSKPAPSAPAQDSAPDPLFDRNIFLLRQKHLAINEKYAVWDEQGTALLFVERPAHLFRNLVALFGGLVAGGVVFSLLGFSYQVMPQPLQVGYLLLGSLFAFLTVILVYVRLELKRHVSFYRDETKRSKLLTVRQDKKLELITATFTVLDSNDKLLGTFSKNYLYDILRKRWECRDRTGKLLFTAREDSIIKSILRRLFGPLFGLLRINFILCDPVNDAVLGVFNRSFTILDRYVLDMGDDPRKRIDRRLALAMGVMLDTGERR